MAFTAATRRLLTADEAARELRLARATVYRMVSDGRLPAVRVGPDGPLRIEASELEELLRPAVRGEGD